METECEIHSVFFLIFHILYVKKTFPFMRGE
nr:MAG TPA: hypothetical protein [Caudoviricetes sp.]